MRSLANTARPGEGLAPGYFAVAPEDRCGAATACNTTGHGWLVAATRTPVRPRLHLTVFREGYAADGGIPGYAVRADHRQECPHCFCRTVHHHHHYHHHH